PATGPQATPNVSSLGSEPVSGTFEDNLLLSLLRIVYILSSRQETAMGKSRIQIARADIVRYFDELPNKVLHHADLARILKEQRAFWRLTLGTTTAMFSRFLID